ncbi:helix-turn-helix domain-containing protein [Halalkalicoccus salilacus]|uniref:helix-turn-helix domain-containing protein n=1 Tax=Halalkalicoccus TaxID=332246 RepID=UPI002F9694E3
MAKYSTGGSGGGDDGDACELCGAATDSLRTASIAGATLQVCADCAPHDDAKRSKSTSGGNGGEDGRDRKKRAARNVAAMRDAQQSNSTKWEREGTNYDDDPLPYLVSGYGDRMSEARQEAGLQLSELADDLEVPEEQLMAVEQGRAARAGVGGSLIAEIESALEIELAE